MSGNGGTAVGVLANLPLFPDLTDDEVDQVADAVRDFLGRK